MSVPKLGATEVRRLESIHSRCSDPDACMEAVAIRIVDAGRDKHIVERTCSILRQLEVVLSRTPRGEVDDGLSGNSARTLARR